MSRYKLTERIRDTMRGRGYKLVCKMCDVSIKIGQDVESKPSKYRRWKCTQCDKVFKEKPQKKVMVGEHWYFVCQKCGGIVYNYGRKFYHADCYDGSHIDVSDEDGDEDE